MGRIASRQHGVVTRVQLLDARLSPGQIRQMLAEGTLLREHRAVYRVGHRAPSVEARYMAAVLAAGEGAVLCHQAAGWHWGVLKGSAPPPEVLTPTERRIAGITTHRTRRPTEATTWKRIPITTVPRTLTDLAASLPLDGLARACHEAGIKHGTTPAQVEEVLGRKPHAPGAALLRAVLRGESPVTLSALERRFLRLLRAEGLPLPLTNRPKDGHHLDCRWPTHQLTVELDSYAFHNSRHSWEQDRRRERVAYARGDRHRRYTWADVFEDPALMLSELRELLKGWRHADPARR